MRRWKTSKYLWLLIALIVGAAVRFWNLTGASLFIDEGFVFHIAAQDPRGILNLVAHGDFHPPLFYLVTHYLVNALHWPPWDYRYLTAAFSLMGIAATWGIAQRFFGTTAAAIAALALALDPAIIVWDRLYRMYAVLVSLSAVSWWLLLKSTDPATGRRWPWWTLYGVAVVILPYLHYVGVFVIAGQFAYALTRARRVWPVLILNVLAILALVPWAWALRVQYHQAHYALPLSSPEFSGASVISNVVAFGAPENWILLRQFDLVVAILAVAIVLVGICLGRRSAVPFWLGPIALHILLSFATGINLLLPRYMYPYVPAFCICVGLIASRLIVMRARIAGIAFIAAYFGVAVMGVYNVVLVPYYQFSDWYQVNALMLAKENKDDIIVLVQGAEYWVVKDFSAFRRHTIASPLVPNDVGHTIKWLRDNPQRRVWYIENQASFTDNQRLIEHDLARTRRQLGAWQQQRMFEENVVRIFLFGPRLLSAEPSAGRSL